MSEPRPSLLIGVDYGGVCSAASDRYETEPTDLSVENGINVPDCLETLHLLKSQGHRLVLISFCGKQRSISTRKYFYKIDNPFTELYFVRKRDYKTHVCKKLQVDVMIDDRLDILMTIPPTQTIQFGSHESNSLVKFTPTRVVQTWREIPDIIASLSKLDLPDGSAVDINKMCY